MDFESLKSQVSNLTLYDLKAGVRKVQNAVMNLTEMESMVREATNADPWGAPSSLMAQIAQGTHNYQQLNEIMPMIYKRFTDKTAEEWRQIYKALQLLEFLIKNGSERVVDDARSHLSLIRMLRQFHYIDPNGKDQGINVRNRSQELAKLLGDVDAIRTERKKARANKNKYGGVEGGAGLGGAGFSAGSSRYGGFGSETGGFGGGYGGEVYGDGGGFGGEDPEFRFQGTQRRGDDFEEYDAGDDEEDTHSAPAKTTTSAAASTTRTQVKREAPAAPKPKEPAQDLFDFGDEPAAPAKAANGPSKAPAKSALDDFGGDDDFDDFQSAATPAPAPANINPLAALSSPPATYTTTSATRFAAPQPVAAAQMAPLNTILSAPSPAPSATSSVAAPTSAVTSPTTHIKPLQPAGGYKASGPNYFTSVRADINSTSTGQPAPFSQRAQTATPTSGSTYTSGTSMASLGKPTTKATPASSSGGDAFGSLWSTASAKAGVPQKSAPGKGVGMAAMQKEKSSAGIWGAASAGPSPVPRTGAQGTSSKPTQPLGNGLDHLLG